jgi:hypothetical protein
MEIEYRRGWLRDWEDQRERDYPPYSAEAPEDYMELSADHEIRTPAA